MVKLKLKQKIILMHLDGESNRSIATKLHISKDTVNKYVKEYEEKKKELLLMDSESDPSELIQSIVEKPRYNADNREPLKATPEIIEEIEKCMELNRTKRVMGMSKQVMKKIDIHEYLLENGHDISYSTVKRLVSELETKHAEAFIRQEYRLGEVCEFDWGTVKLDIADSGYQKWQMAVFTAARSGYRFAKLFKTQDTPAFQQAHVDFFDHAGGGYKTMVYDNMRVAVARFTGPSEKEPTKALSELSIYYGFNFRFCNTCRGNEKGHVERSVEFIRRKVFSGPGRDRFQSLEEANNFLFDGCMRLNSKKDSNGEIPAEVLIEERKHLTGKLPRFECCIQSDNRVDKYSTIVVFQNHYSVPDTLVGKMVSVKAFTEKILVFHDGDIVAVHRRSYRNHDWRIEINHYLRTLNKKPGALSQSTALLQVDTQIKHIYEQYYSTDSKTFLRVLEIICEKGVSAVIEALRELEIVSPMDMSADKVRVICERNEAIKDVVPISHIDRLTEKSRSSLTAYDMLAALQSGKLQKEVI